MGLDDPDLLYFEQYPEGGRHGHKQLSEKPTIHANCYIRDSHIGPWTELGMGTTLMESTFGAYSYAAGDVSIVYADVGRFCSIASHVRINPGNHPMWRVTQNHFTYRRAMYGFGEDDQEFFEWRRAHRCTIEHDVWLGHGVIVMPGVKIGIGAVVGSGGVVTKDIPPYTIAVGVPARPIKLRFAEPIVEKLLAIRWWEWDHATLGQRFDDLLDVETFVEKYADSKD